MKFETPPDTGWMFGAYSGDLWLILPLALMLGAILFFRFRRTRAKRECRWKKDTRRRAASVRWQCMACGVDAFTRDGKPPKECKRLLRETTL